MPTNQAISIATLIAACSAFTMTARPAAAGPLDPPAGPVAPTPGPEPRTPIGPTTTPGDADSTFRIAAPGSYYLTGNLSGQATKHGIEIAASGVTLDLNGFELRGVPGSLDGVSAVGTNLRNLSIFNGTVALWGGDGVDLKTAPATACRVERLTAAGNTGTGIRGGPAGTITRCTSSRNLADGFHLGVCGVITNCIAIENAAIGINVAAPGTFDQGCVIADCSIRGNALDGIACNSRSFVRGNTCTGNGIGNNGAGIRAVGVDIRIDSNTVNNNQRGIVVAASGNFITRNTCSGNPTNNWDVASANVVLVVNATTNPTAVTTNAGGVAPGSTDPNANFSH